MTMALRLTVAGLVTLLMLASGLSAHAQLGDPPDRIDVPPTLERAPEDALYVEERFGVAITHRQVQYGEAVNSRGEMEQLFLDVYEPVGDDDPFRPVIVFAPGGGFVYVGESEYWVRQLVQRGYVVALMTSYRIRPELPTGFEEFISLDGIEAIATGQATEAARDAQHDMQAAIRWMHANAHHLRADPTRIVASGNSAGAIMSWLVAYNHTDVGNTGNPGWPSHVVAAISRAGGYILGVQEDRPLTPGLPPVLAFHGLLDTTVPIAFALGPCSNTVAVGNVCDLRVYPQDDHFASERYDEFAAESADFLWRHVLSTDRVPTSFVNVDARLRGTTVTVTGRVIDDGGAGLQDQRVLARVMDEWVETTTNTDGAFELTARAVGHGGTVDVILRHHGHSNANSLDGPPVAPAQTSVQASSAFQTADNTPVLRAPGPALPSTGGGAGAAVLALTLAALLAHAIQHGGRTR